MDKRDIKDYYQINPKHLKEIYSLQVELLKLQKYVSEQKMRVAILFEGRDTAGKGSAINRFTQFLNPQNYRVVALGKPTETERGQWYFQRYIKELPNAGEMVFFDRSWYNRAVVEPVMGFCSKAQYYTFMEQVNTFEQMLIQDGIIVIKFWFSIKMLSQKERIKQRLSSPLQQWKVSPVDLAAQEKWEDFTNYKNRMFRETHTSHCPWIIVKGDEREVSRIQAMRYVLSKFEYDDKSKDLKPVKPKMLFKWMHYDNK